MPGMDNIINVNNPYHNIYAVKNKVIIHLTLNVLTNRCKYMLVLLNLLADELWYEQDDGIISIYYLEKGRTINGEYYASLLAQLVNEIKKTRRHLGEQKVLFHQNNERVHTCAVAIAKLH